MAQPKIYFSPLNPIRFVPVNNPGQDKYNYNDFDKTAFYEFIKEWDEKKPYAYKIKKLDNNKVDQMPIYLIATQPFMAQVRVIDSYGDPVTSFQDFVNVPNAPTAMDGQSIYHQMHINSIMNGSMTNGIYYLVIRWGYDPLGGTNATAYEDFISEPICLQDEHPNTVLIEYRNRYSKELMPFDQTRQTLTLRVEGAISNFDPKLDSVVFQDQNYITRLLSAHAYRGWTFFAGGNGEAIPDYMIDKINHIMSVDEVYIEGKRYSIEEGASLERIDVDNYPLSFASIELVEYNEFTNYAFDTTKNSGTEGDSVVVGNIPSKYPYAVGQVTMAKKRLILEVDVSTGQETGRYRPQLDTVFLEFNKGYIVYNNAAEVDVIADMNIEASTQGMLGHFEVNSNNDLIYVLGSGENGSNYNYTDIEILTQHVKLHNNDSVDVETKMKLYGFIGEQSRYIYGKIGNILSYHNSKIINGLLEITLNMGSGDSLLFHDDDINTWTINSKRTQYISGEFPSRLSGIRIEELNTENVQPNLPFDMKTLILAKQSLWGVAIIGSNTEGISNMYNVNEDVIGWNNLTYIDIRWNYGITSSSLTSMLVQMFQAHIDNRFYVNGGFLKMESQTPVATLLPPAFMPAANLVATYNWTLTYD